MEFLYGGLAAIKRFLHAVDRDQHRFDLYVRSRFDFGKNFFKRFTRRHHVLYDSDLISVMQFLSYEQAAFAVILYFLPVKAEPVSTPLRASAILVETASGIPL